MKMHLKHDIPKLVISPSVTQEQAEASMMLLQNFNQCIMGLAHFSGTTPWERHQDDELIQILEGKVDIIILNPEKVITESLQAGECFVVPSCIWHKQHSQEGVKLLFITSQEGNETSMEENPQ
jgi:mannose-6-phosphate isomerase-like protein (cupin superfamily)